MGNLLILCDCERPKSKNAREGIETGVSLRGGAQEQQGPKSKNAREGIETPACAVVRRGRARVRKAKMPARALKLLLSPDLDVDGGY